MKKTFFFTLLFCLFSFKAISQSNANSDPDGLVRTTGDCNPMTYCSFDDIPVLHLSDTSQNTDLPQRIRNDTLKYFPPIYNQGSVYCCTFASEIGYIFTYEMNRIRDVSAGLAWTIEEGIDTIDLQNLYHPLFGYNFANEGDYHHLTCQTDGFKLLKSIGCPMYSCYYTNLSNLPGSVKAKYWMSSFDGYADAIRPDLFDSEIIVDEDATLRLTDSVRIIAKRGDCRIIVRGSMTLGNGVVFEACDGATLELIFENNADLSVSNATFINCDLVLPGKNLSFSNCHFIGTPFLADLSMYKPQNNTATLMNCDFVPNGKTIPEAIYIKHYLHYLVHGCSIDATGAGSFVSGIAIFNSGNNMGSQNISNNSVKGCMRGGVLMYASYGDITANVIEGNGQGVKLYNNCNIGQFMGNCQATTGTETQYIHDNGTYEVFMTANCVPETFMYNYISDDDNVPFVYHDITAYYVDPGITPRSDIDVSMNYWGSNFTPSTHLYTNQNLTGFVYLPYWVMGNCATIENTNASAMVFEADSLNAIGEYASAKSLYLQVVDDYPNTISAETAMKTLLVLEEHTGNDYNALKAYYQTNSAIASDENLNHLASSLANKCNERMENYNEAIAWYEEVLTNPNTSFNDSIFAAIDLGDLYLKMDAGGEKGIGKLGQYRPESAIEHERQTCRALSLLPRNTVDEQGRTEHSPIQDLELSVGDNDTVLLTWDLPNDYNASPLELSWVRSDTINDMSQYGYDSYMGALYDESDLCHFIGWKIESISFYKISNWTHFISVFEQKQGEEMHELYQQEIPDEAPFGLNTIMLEEDLQIERSTKYWFAIRIKNEGQYGYTFPLGTWDGQANEGKSNLFLNYGASTWFSYPGFNGWIKTTLVNTDGKVSQPVQANNKENQPLTGYHIYRNGTLIKAIPYSFVTYFTDTEFTRETDVEYCVTAVYGEEESEPLCATTVITKIEEDLKKEGITVSPNPTNGLIRIEGAEVSEAQVYNTMGQLVKTVENTNEIDLSGLTPSVYSLRIKDTQGVNMNKKVVVKQH